MIRRCTCCVNPSTRPGIFFDETGLCPVCHHTTGMQQGFVDWEARRNELEEILRWGRAHTGDSHDCIVTVSGGKDSTRQAMYVRDELYGNPLLVSCVYPPEQLSERGAHNLGNLISLGFDALTVSPDPRTWRELMRQGFFRFGNWAKSTEMALYAIPVHVAIAYRIPLIFYGENPVWTIGERHGTLDGDASQLKQGNTIRSGPDVLVPEGISSRNTHFYRYPSDEEMSSALLRLVYLGYYIPDWSGQNNAAFAIRHGLQIRDDPPEKIGDLWGFTGLDEDFRIVNQMIKHVKLGFGHITDQVCEAINAGQMTRNEGMELVRNYDGRCDPEYVQRFCRYLGISEEEFWRVVESFRDPDLWVRNASGCWVLQEE